MKILSVNVSLPRKIIFKDKAISTSIFKEPIDKAIKVEKLGRYCAFIKDGKKSNTMTITFLIF